MRRLLSIIVIICILIIALVFAKQYLYKNVKHQPVAVVPIQHAVQQAVPKTIQAIPVSPPKQQLTQTVNKPDDIDVNKLIQISASAGLQPKALKAALNAYTWARDHGKLGENKDTLTVVDFTLPSYEKRMWVLDLRQNKVLMKLYTTQGSGSGEVYATRFSNQVGTDDSSLGLYVTGDEYYGKHGKSIRIDGLQEGINNNARMRDIVIHSANYASPQYIEANHRAGRSWGCFAVAPAKKDTLLDYINGGSAFFAYASPIVKSPIVSHGPIPISL